MRLAPLLLAGTLLPAPVLADLAGYVARDEPAAKATVASETKEDGFAVTTLDLVSQTWRGKAWSHRLRIFVPEARETSDVALLAVSGADGFGRELARRTRLPVATLSDVPNQPLFFGKREDDLLAHTFAAYLETGDEEWPLLFPMAKAAVAAIDVLAERGVAKRFVVTGASKRGWTSWLAGIADERVVGIVPVVFDNLSFAAQMRHQTELWGDYSEELGDYTLRGLQSQIATPRGAKLVAMVDPVAYGERLGRFRKLVVNGTNDPYWAIDAIRFYWSVLPGEKSVLYVPNGTHGIAHEERVVSATAAFARHVAKDRPMPSLEMETRSGDATVEARIVSDGAPRAARLWLARDERGDFRRARFEAIEAKRENGAFIATFPAPKTGSVAVLAEADFGEGEESFPLSTPVRVLGAEKP